MRPVQVIGAGLAGCEAAWQMAMAGVAVELIDMKPARKTPAHHSPFFAELVCSNSLKAARTDSAAGLLKAEMRRFGSVCLQAADTCQVPAGGALAVDRDQFSQYITERVRNHPLISVREAPIERLPETDLAVVATGPLTDGPLAADISRVCEADSLSFYDAAAPIVTLESIDFSKAFFASRYGKGDDDYINCPMDKDTYTAFRAALVAAERAPVHDFDRPLQVYEGCMPIEVLAGRGEDAIRFGPLKPVGLRDPKTGRRPWAVVQLRRENAGGTLYNLVGFQTNLKFGAQKSVFSMIPGLEQAEFVRYGVMHRNSFLDSPRLLMRDLSLKKRDNLFFAGQMTGVEGYMESAACGILAGQNVLRRLAGKPPLILPEITMIGALLHYITDETVVRFQPMGANFGILPPLDEKIRDKRARYAALANRSLSWFDANKNALLYAFNQGLSSN